MPVTAKLSRRFYETFGDELTNELVEWLNQVDASYRSELRELNDLNFGRFEARLERQLADLRAEVKTGAAELRAEMARLEGGLLARIGMAEGRLARLTLLLWVATLGAITALLKL
jgi:hypothetical protein